VQLSIGCQLELQCEGSTPILALVHPHISLQAICNWVHQAIRFDYGASQPHKTASQTLADGAGVCRAGLDGHPDRGSAGGFLRLV
jgi:hypothetical protein